MIPTRISLRNFMCYRGDGDAPQTLVLDGLHVVCLSGENGAGKSALLDAITWVLWGQGRTPDDDLITQGEAEMLVELEFLLGDQRYRALRKRLRGRTGPRGGQGAGKSELYLDVRDGERWRPLAEATIRETQARIDALLRMSYQTFINASFLLQGRADEFTARTPAERKQVLAEILDLGEYAALESRARERSRALDDQLRGLRGQIGQLELSAAQAGFWRDEVAAAQARAEQAAQGLATAETERDLARERLRALQARADQRSELRRQLEKLRAEQAERARDLAALDQRIASARALVSRRDAIRSGLAELAAARAEHDRLEALRDRHAQLVERQTELRQQFRDARGELQQRLGQLEQRRDDLERRAARRADLAAEQADLAARILALASLAVEQAAAHDQRQSLALRLGEVADMQRRQEQLRAHIRLRQDSLVAVREEQQRRLKDLDHQLAGLERLRADVAAAGAAAAELPQAEAAQAGLRAQAQADLDMVSGQRAECARLKDAAEKLKANQQILADAGGSCPICRSDLGPSGVAHVQQHYDQELAELRAGYAAAKRAADDGEARLTQTRAELLGLERRLAELQRAAAQQQPLAAQLAQAEAWQAERAQVEATLANVQRQIAAAEFEPEAQAELARLDGELAQLGDPDELRRQLAALDEQLAAREARLRERGQLEGRRDARADELAALDQELGGLPGLQAAAAELRRQLDQNDFAHDVRAAGERLAADIAALGYSREAQAAAAAQARELARWEQDERELALAEQRLADALPRREQLAEQAARDAAEDARLAAEDAGLEQELRGLPLANEQLRAGEAALADARRTASVAERDLAEKRTELRKAEEHAAELERRRAEEQDLASRQDLFAELGEALGKKGVQAMLIETAIPQIEHEANRLLGRMTDNQMHLSFEMQRDTKKGDTVETLEIKIADTLGTRAYDAFSGGEAMRANFAVRVALSRLLAHRAGARLETLVIDEGFGTLDASGRERMVEAITTVQEDFRRIIVITHIDELKERFPALIEVTKTAFGSRWELR